MFGPYGHVSGAYALGSHPSQNGERMVEVKGICWGTYVYLVVFGAIEVVAAVFDWSRPVTGRRELCLRTRCLYISSLFSYLDKSNVEDDISILNTVVTTAIRVPSWTVGKAEGGVLL